MAAPVSHRGLAQRLLSGSTQGISASQVNCFRVNAVVERLASHFRPGSRSDPSEFCTLCLSLARGIDYAIASNDIPPSAQELPSILKQLQLYLRKNDPQLLAAVMVLMISVKSACQNRWFLVQDADELLTLANEIGRCFSSPADTNVESAKRNIIISNVLSRFFPRIKMGHVLAFLEVKPGFGAFAVDFHILKDKVSSAQEKIGLFVIQTDSVSTSSCLISPPKVNFLLNGNAVYRRVDVSMDTGPQLPTNVTAMLKYGTNLLQAVGQFSGNYIVAVAFMTMEKSSGVPALEDYVQPAAVALESDSEIIEGSSRISLNCPISFTRIKTPVKGQRCKHPQCFDFENYVDINSRRPSWRCPHCNQSVCYTDIRVDQNMVKVLREVAGNVADVLISADGSWKPVIEKDGHQTEEHHERTLTNNQEGSEQCESTRSLNTQTNAVDLTIEDVEENAAMDTYGTEDCKPFKDMVPGYSFANLPGSSAIHTSEIPSSSFAEIPAPSGIDNTSESGSNLHRVEDDFWSGIFIVDSTTNCSVPNTVTESPATNSMMTPVLTDAVSPAFNRELVDAHGASQATSSIVQAQTFSQSNLQLQSPQVGNSLITTDFGRPIPRYVNRNPIAVQALPAPSQVPASHNRSRTNFNPVMSNGSSVGTTDSRFLHSSSTPDMSSSSMLHYSMAQNWDHQGRSYIASQPQQVVGLPATSDVVGSYRQPQVVGLPATSDVMRSYRPQQVVGLPTTNDAAGSYRSSSGLPSEHHSTHHQSPTHVGSQTTSQVPTMQTSTQTRRHMPPSHRPSPVARSPPAVPVQLQAVRTGSSFPMTADGFRSPLGEQRGMNTGPVSRTDVLNELPSEQNWRPTGRMRGSLTGRPYSAALNQLMIQPTNSAQAAVPTPDLSQPQGQGIPPQMRGLLPNPHIAPNPYLRTGDLPGNPGNRH